MLKRFEAVLYFIFLSVFSFMCCFSFLSVLFFECGAVEVS